MIEIFKEIEGVISGAVPGASVSTVKQGGTKGGLSISIDHGSSESDSEVGLDYLVDRFTTWVEFRSPYQNWGEALESALAVKQALILKKSHKWTPGNIEREESAEAYILRLNITTRQIFKPRP